MTVEFELRRADWSLLLDLAKPMPRWLGNYTIPNWADTGRIDHPGFATGRPFFVNGGQANWYGNFPGAIPKIYSEADHLRWSYLDYQHPFAPESRFSVTIILGVF